jgi:multidrug efflux pump subunit AcrA (membrane-fusion protein)
LEFQDIVCSPIFDSFRTEHTPEYQQTVAKLEQKQADAAAARAQNIAERAAQKAQELARVAEEQAKQATADRKARLAQNILKAQQVLHDVTQATEDSGYNFDGLDDFFQGIFQPGGNQQMSAKITRYVHSHGAEHARTMFARSAPAKEEYISGELADIYQREGCAIQEILTRNSTTTVTELLKVFSMEQLAAEIQEAAPWLWKALVVLSEPDKSTHRESAGEARRDKGLVRFI